MGPKARSKKKRHAYYLKHREVELAKQKKRRKEIAEVRRKWSRTEKGSLCIRRNRLRNYYSMTIEEYEKLHNAQGGLCAICGKANPNGNLLAIDHCHETGRIRGLLCFRCNVGLGSLDDDVSIIRKALSYLQEK